LSENPDSIADVDPAAAREGAGAIIARNSGWMMGAKLVSAALSLIFLAIAANKLGAEDYGTLNFVLSLAGFFHVLLDLGYMTLLIERSSKDRSKLEWHLSGNLGLKLLLYPGGLVLYSLLLLKYPHLWDQPVVFLCGYLFVMLNTQGYLLRGVLMSKESFEQIGKSEVFERFIVLSAGLAVLFTIPSLAPYVLVLVVANFLKVVYLSVAVRRAGVQSRWRWDTQYVTSNWNAALPHALYAVAGMLHFRIDSVMIGNMRPFSEVGLYSAAFDKVLGFVIFGQMITNAVTPTASRLFAEDRSEFRRIFDRAFFLLPVIAVPITVGLAICSKGIVALFHSVEYTSSWLALAWLAPYVLLRYWIYLYASMLLAAGRISSHVIAESIGVAAKIALNLILIPKMGFAGAAVSFAIAEVVVLVIDAGLARKIDLPFVPLLRAWQPLLAGVMMGGAVWGVRGFGLLPQIAVGGCTYIGLCVLFGVLRREPGIEAFAMRVVSKLRR